jgi:ABC-type amino acid transport substrate-binding protein
MGVVSACSGERDGAGQSPSESRSAAPAKQGASAAKPANAPEILVGAGLIPGMVNSSTDGLMVDLIKAMAETYQSGVGGASKGGSMVIKAMTLGRLDVDLVEGSVDITMPYIRMKPEDDAQFKYRFTKQAYGNVAFVLYSRKAAPVTVEALKSAAGQQPFPYKVESTEYEWGFPVTQFLSFESAFKKLSAGRIDAFIWAQEEADEELRRQGDKGIVRELYGVYEDVFAVQRNARGDFVEKVYDQVLDAMRRSGKLKALYSKIHLPFDPWQP